MKEFPMKLDKKYYTVLANDLIRGKQSMSLQEARIVRLLVTQVVKEDKDFKTYACRITDLASFLGIAKNNLYRDIQRICESLIEKKIKVSTGNPKEPWRIFQWIQLAQYDGNGNLTLMLSNQIAPYVLNLEKWFTQYQIGNILAMDSYYAIRLYELLRCDDGITRQEKAYQEYTVQELRVFFDCEEKFSKISQFKLKVIDTAISEINKKTDIRVSVEYKKTGRAITSLRFYIMPTPELLGQQRL